MAYASLSRAVKCHTSDLRLLQNKDGPENTENGNGTRLSPRRRYGYGGKAHAKERVTWSQCERSSLNITATVMRIPAIVLYSSSEGSTRRIFMHVIVHHRDPLHDMLYDKILRPMSSLVQSSSWSSYL